MSSKCEHLMPRPVQPRREPVWHGKCHRGHAKCLRAAKRNEARDRKYHYDARQRARAS